MGTADCRLRLLQSEMRNMPAEIRHPSGFPQCLLPPESVCSPHSVQPNTEYSMPASCNRLQHNRKYG